MEIAQLNTYFKSVFAQVDDRQYNGLELEGTRRIEKVLLSVSLSEALIDYAVSHNYDAIFVHHGVFGSEVFHFEGGKARKFRKLFTSGISLFAFHLPLDAQPDFGHNAVMAQAIGLSDVTPLECGFVGINAGALSCRQIAERIAEVMARPSYALHVEGSGEFVPEIVDSMNLYINTEIPTKVFVCSGGSGYLLQKAASAHCDLFVLGEISEYLPEVAREAGMSLIAAGHWRTETVGILEMQRILKEKGLQADFLALDNIV